jgi:hypothetical protein
LGWIALTIAAGLGSRSSSLPWWVLLYVGDVLWGVLFYLLYACWLRRARRSVVAAAAAATTVLIELSQLYRDDWIDAVRATRLGGLLLGHQFLWSDLVAVSFGAVLPALLGRRLEMARSLASSSWLHRG